MLKRKTIMLSVFAIFAVGLLTYFFQSQSAYAVFPTNSTPIDNFNRANTNSIGGQTTSAGYTWSNTQLQNTIPTALGINSNQLNLNSGGNNAYITTPFGPDVEIYVSVPVLPINGEYIALWARHQNTGTTGFSSYALVYIHATSGNATWSLRRYDSGVSTTLSNISASAISANDSIGIDVIGSGSSVTLTTYRRSGGVWSTIGSVNDTSGSRITAAGRLGIELSDVTTRLDNFSGGNLNTSPASPTLSLPVDTATGVSTTPQFQLRTTDADSDYLRYKIEVCSTSNCSAIVRTIDQTAAQTGWSGQDTQTATAYIGNSVITSSTIAVHTYQAPALSPGTQYWWRAYAIDPGGTNVFSSVSSIFSFVTAAASQGSAGSGSTSSSGASSVVDTPPKNTPKMK
jgi:hypothetical protein